MPVLPILKYPDPRLRVKTRLVERVDDAVKTLINDMFETIYSDPYNAGLAATQVASDLRIAVIDMSSDRDQPLCLVNLEIIDHADISEREEGCLSFPGVYAKVKRAERVTFRALDRDGKPFEQTVEGMWAVAVQHEADHLNGILFVDHLSQLKRSLILKKYEKYAREAL